MMSAHSEALKSSCRVCGNTLQHKWRSLKKTFPSSLPTYPVLGLENELFDCFGVITFDDSHVSIHPSSICFTCNSTLRNWRKKDKTYTHSIIPAEWSAHNDQHCMVCIRFEQRKKPGRPSKSKGNRGRPLSKKLQDTLRATSHQTEIIESINQCAGADFIGDLQITEEQMKMVTENVKCPICKTILNRAVITCTQEHMACAPCLIKAVQTLPVCPICRDSLNIKPLGRFANNTLAETTISCDLCKQDTILERLHIHSGQCKKVHICESTNIPPQPNPPVAVMSPTTATRVLLHAQDLTDVRDANELESLTTKLVKRKITHNAPGEPVTLQTGGRVSIWMFDINLHEI